MAWQSCNDRQCNMRGNALVNQSFAHAESALGAGVPDDQVGV